MTSDRNCAYDPVQNIDVDENQDSEISEEIPHKISYRYWICTILLFIGALFIGQHFEKIIIHSSDLEDLNDCDENSWGHNGMDYRGCVNTTENGLKCRVWDENNTVKPSDYPNGGISSKHNYCRNPDGSEKRTWCYTEDYVSKKRGKRWGYCSTQNHNGMFRVSREAYAKIVHLSAREVGPIIESVHTDCRLFLVPGKKKPKVKFKCRENGSLQKELCSTANLCLVVTDEDIWPGVKVNYSKADSRKAALIMVADTLTYLQDNQNFYSLLNKASYALQTGRSMFMWLGTVEESLLGTKHHEELEEAFGIGCKGFEKNSVHHYKSLAFLTLFVKQKFVQAESLIFMDFDLVLSEKAFEIAQKVGPENYFELSPQASLAGAQYYKGHTIVSTAIFLARNTTWVHDFLGMWWFSRCGIKDQRGLWLLLFGTFSAWTVPSVSLPDIAQFEYPPKLFKKYNPTIRLTHLRFMEKSTFTIQNSWEQLAKHTEDENFPQPGKVVPLFHHYPGKKWEYSKKYSEPKYFTQPFEAPFMLFLPMIEINFTRSDGSIMHLPRIRWDISADNSFSAHIEHDEMKERPKQEACRGDRCWPYIRGQKRIIHGPVLMDVLQITRLEEESH